MAMSLIKRALVACIPDVMMTTPVPFGGRIRFRARVHKGFLVRRVTDYPNERGIFRCYDEVLSPESIVFDVGANIGLHSVPLALRATRGQVVAFEPDADNVQLLRENLAQNGVSRRVRVEAKAVSDRAGKVEFWRDVVTSATGTIAPSSGNSWFHQHTGRRPLKVEVEATTIDAFVAAHPELAPSLVKIDVEGAEARVLDGMEVTARTHRPDIIIDGTPRRCAERLLEWGYRLTEVRTRTPVLDVRDDLPSTIFATRQR